MSVEPEAPRRILRLSRVSRLAELTRRRVMHALDDADDASVSPERVRELCALIVEADEDARSSGSAAPAQSSTVPHELLEALVRAFPDERLSDVERREEVMKLVREAAAGGLEKRDDGSRATSSMATRVIELTPRFVVKTRDATGTKVFVNVCGSDFVGAPEDGHDAWAQGLMPKAVARALEAGRRDDAALAFPLSCGDGRVDIDTMGQPAMVYDVVFNTAALRHAAPYKPLKRFLSELALKRVAEKHTIGELDSEYKLPTRKFIGAATPPPQRIRVESTELMSILDSGGVNAKQSEQRLSLEIEYVGRPVTLVKLRVAIPQGQKPSDVTVCVVREGLDVSVAGAHAPGERVELPFMLDPTSAWGRVDGDSVEYEIAYLPYKVAVERLVAG